MKIIPGKKPNVAGSVTSTPSKMVRKGCGCGQKGKVVKRG